MIDRNGQKVGVGDLVKILEIDEGFLGVLPEDERSLHKQLLNTVLAVDDIVEGSTKASVSFWKEFERGLYHGGLYMLPHEFEIVRKAGKERA